MNVTIALGSRANFGSIRSAMVALRQRGAEVRPVLFASALSDRYGDVKASLQHDDFRPFAALATHIEGDVSDMAKVSGLSAIEWGTFLRNNHTDSVVVVGDRHECLGPAMAAAYSGTRLVHTMGGEMSGNIDDKVRDSITQLADEHCVATRGAADRVQRMTSVWKVDSLIEANSRIHVTGCPRIDTVRQALEASQPRLQTDDGFAVVDARERAYRNMILVSQHPVTTSWQNSHAEMTETLRAVEAVAQRHRMQVELFWPNADAGTGGTHQAIRDWLNSPGGNSVIVRTHRAMGPDDYARMMAACRVMVGNSSSALRDGAWIGTPAVNVGDRQRGREHGENVTDCPSRTDAIVHQLEHQISHGPYRSSTLYGDGTAGEKVAAAVLS